MRSDFSLQAGAAGALAGFVGFASTFAVIINGLTKVGASPEQAASGLMAAALAMGLCGIVLSTVSRLPISSAWSTPGAALLATTGAVDGGFEAAVGAFLLTGALIVLSGLFKPLGRWVASIPAPLANAMLAGVLLELCFAPVRAVAEHPLPALAIILAWLIVAKLKRVLAMPAAVIVAAIAIAATTHLSAASFGSPWPHPVLVTPTLSIGAVIGIALPLFIVTMASQNIPGIAVLSVNGYHPPPGRLFVATGLFSIVGAFFGGHTVNLAAITAAMCAGPDANPDPKKRYWAAIIAGLIYVIFGLLAGVAAAFIGASPPILIEAVAGLALLGAFGSSVMNAVNAPVDREAAVVTLLVTASGVGFLGISGAFWGLIAGGIVMLVTRWRALRPPSAPPVKT
ncbi:MAG TPA: benzoate/H(+) symporter BenE family transporter [Magnetospirillaceae bacterium]|jgi:benzoate membrane transport protein